MLTKEKRNKKNREFIYRNNKPVSVIIDIEEYEELLERVEDIEDVEFIRNLKKKKLEFRSFDAFLEEVSS
jgi:PHD/YefM family antitoxin component YafN of YafNO toxin-antitoxin module